MHEFSLAEEIVRIVEKSACNAGKSKVSAIELQIGELSGVEETALITALECLIENTILKDARVNIQGSKGVALCKECNAEFNLSDIFSLCPKCNGYLKEIVSGKEFNVLSIEAE